MENRNLVIAEYLQLRLILNRPNLEKNQRTEIDFIAVKKGPLGYSLMATLRGVQTPKQLELCKATNRLGWEAANNSGLNNLEEYCAEYLQKILGRYFTPEALNKAIMSLKKDLQGLGIP